MSPPETFSLVELFGMSSSIRTWTSDYGLPNDENSLNNALIAEKAEGKAILCMDPQMIAN